MEKDPNSVATSLSPSTTDFQNKTNEDNSLALPSVKEVYCCPYSSCNFATAWKSSLNMHMKTHTGNKNPKASFVPV